LTESTTIQSAPRDIPLGYLRAFLTVLVVAHHASLAYHPFAPRAPESLRAVPYMWTAFPIVDEHKWPMAPLFVGVNDVFFMSLMFLISGVFAAPGLRCKSAGAFLADRAFRLGLTFVVSASLLAPLAYYPSYLATGADASPRPFMSEWLALGAWPAGPAWFLWVLMAFATIAVLLHKAAPRGLDALGRLAERLSSPGRFFSALVVVSAIAYLPMARIFTPDAWSNWGPFWVQTSRVFNYGVYFLAGLALGSFGRDRGLLARDGALARRWFLWMGVTILSIGLSLVALAEIMPTWANGGSGPGIVLAAAGNFTWVLICASASLVCLGFFLTFARTAHPIIDSLAANAFGIYLFHYACVSWLQLVIVGVDLSGGLKMLAVTTCALGLSWITTATLRRVPGVSRVL
jgi:hypothetical protein